MKHDIQLEITDLTDAAVGVELEAEELQAVAGARYMVCDCGKPMRADDWVIG